MYMTPWKLLPVLAAGCCAAISLAGAAHARTAPTTITDAEVLGIYIQVNGFDIETALLGRAQGSSSKVRELGARVSSDHMGVRQAAFDLATACKVSPALPSDRDAAASEHARAMTSLKALTGVAFDKAYLQHELTFHRGAIDAMRQVLMPSATCPALKSHLRDVLPAFEHHLSQTEALARALPAR